MPITHSHYEPDHKGIGEFLRSHQLRDAVSQGAQDVAKLAAESAPAKIAGEFDVQAGPDVIVTKRNPEPRLSEHVVNNNRAAAAIEFGSGRGRPGSAGDRPQGGYSYPGRHLGKAGARIADRLGGNDD